MTVFKFFSPVWFEGDFDDGIMALFGLIVNLGGATVWIYGISFLVAHAVKTALG